MWLYLGEERLVHPNFHSKDCGTHQVPMYGERWIVVHSKSQCKEKGAKLWICQVLIQILTVRPVLNNGSSHPNLSGASSMSSARLPASLIIEQIKLKPPTCICTQFYFIQDGVQYMSILSYSHCFYHHVRQLHTYLPVLPSCFASSPSASTQHRTLPHVLQPASLPSASTQPRTLPCVLQPTHHPPFWTKPNYKTKWN